MQLTIQVTDSNSDVVTSNISLLSATSGAVTDNESDGGAPSISINSSSNSPASSKSDQLNIGGPPQWLIDGLSNGKGSGNTASTGMGNDFGNNGGAAPSFSQV